MTLFLNRASRQMKNSLSPSFSASTLQFTLIKSLFSRLSLDLTAVWDNPIFLPIFVVPCSQLSLIILMIFLSVSSSVFIVIVIQFRYISYSIEVYEYFKLKYYLDNFYSK